MTETELSNLALGHIGTSKTIATLSEQSQEARACNRWITAAKEEFLSMKRWRFARKVGVDLALVDDSPTTDYWAYSYRFPTDCIEAIEIPFAIADNSSNFNDEILRGSQFFQNGIPFEKVFDDSGYLILTNQQNAQLTYTGKPPINIWPAYICIAFSYLLASYIARELAKGDFAVSSTKLYDQFKEKFDSAAAKDDNEPIPIRTNHSPMSLSRR